MQYRFANVTCLSVGPNRFNSACTRSSLPKTVPKLGHYRNCIIYRLDTVFAQPLDERAEKQETSVNG